METWNGKFKELPKDLHDFYKDESDEHIQEGIIQAFTVLAYRSGLSIFDEVECFYNSTVMAQKVLDDVGPMITAVVESMKANLN